MTIRLSPSSIRIIPPYFSIQGKNTRFDIYQTMTVTAAAPAASFSMSFSGNMNNETFNITFEWETGESDTILFST